jgi:hypothetical protein
MAMMAGGREYYLCMFTLTIHTAPSSKSTICLSDGHDISSFYQKL